MSKPTEDQVTCPNCGTTSDTQIWESLNSILNHDEVEQLLEGTLFMHECPECHSTIELTYPCLYNDMQAHAMVQYIVDEKDTDEAIQTIEKLQKDDDAAEETALVRTRIVTSHNALREKVLLFRDGLDDMAVEALKAVIMNRFIDEGQIQNGADADVFYSGLTEAGDLVLAFIVDGKSAQTMAPKALYARILAMVEDSAYAKKGAYLVDSVWAELFFKNQAGM